MKFIQFSLVLTFLTLASAYHFNTPVEEDHGGGHGGGKAAACQALCGQFIGKGGGGPVPYSGETALARTGGKEQDCYPKGARCHEQWQCCNTCNAIYNLGNCT